MEYLWQNAMTSYDHHFYYVFDSRPHSRSIVGISFATADGYDSKLCPDDLVHGCPLQVHRRGECLLLLSKQDHATINYGYSCA